MGLGLAARLAAKGIPIVIGSRKSERAKKAAEQVREKYSKAKKGKAPVVEGMINADAARCSRTVMLTVPFKAQLETLEELRDSLETGTVLVDATARLETSIGGKPTRTVDVWLGSAAEQAQESVPRGVTVISALHTVSAKNLQDLSNKLDEDVLICGDDRKAKKAVAELVSKVEGLRPVDCGGLEMARITEQLTPLLISINKRNKIKHSGIKLTGLPNGS